MILIRVSVLIWWELLVMIDKIPFIVSFICSPYCYGFDYIRMENKFSMILLFKVSSLQTKKHS